MRDWGALTSRHGGTCFYEQMVMDGRGDSRGLVSAGQKVPSQREQPGLRKGNLSGQVSSSSASNAARPPPPRLAQGTDADGRARSHAWVTRVTDKRPMLLRPRHPNMPQTQHWAPRMRADLFLAASGKLSEAAQCCDISWPG